MSRPRQKTFDKLQTKFTRYQTDAEKLLRDTMEQEMRAWKSRFPKRRLRFLDAMGAQVIWIDDTDITFPSYPWNDPRIEKLTKPMRDLVTWYCEMADRFLIEIDEIKL
jgi:DNA/RNA-binding domain of Phe-tRNA-synthetase-like protein